MGNRSRVLAAVLALLGGAACAPILPANTPFAEARWLDQGWSAEERAWFHHTSQGTATLPVPYAWFVALEQPRLRLFGSPGLVADEEYLRRMGFVPSPRSTQGPSPNPDGLPVGFARLSSATDPRSGTPLPDGIGFTCAACHTGQLEYAGVSLRIDGGPAVTDLSALRQVVGLSLAYTKLVPGRFGRFANRVLGEARSDAQTAALKRELEDMLARGGAWNDFSKPRVEEHPDTVREGFARLDALNRIGNQVFGQNLYAGEGDDALAAKNLQPLTAPVNFPHIWSTSWFDWVQYDGSIMQPMTRNAGEALGVRALASLRDDDEHLYRSSVDVEAIFALEQLLAGAPPDAQQGFRGLRAPRWPEDVLGAIDREKAAAGEALYAELCASCHRPAVSSEAFWHDRYWSDPAQNEVGRRYLEVPNIRVDVVGTDPAQARVLTTRRVEIPDFLGIDPGSLGCGGLGEPGVVTETSFAAALGAVVQKTTERYYRERGVPEARRRELDGFRENCLRAKEGYKARPLDGIWATAPYLHNGSVPNLHALLGPESERPERFHLGSRVYDPVHVGYETRDRRGLFELDTTKPGNRNTGHAFSDERTPGVVGRALTEEERWALVEYLKTL